MVTEPTFRWRPVLARRLHVAGWVGAGWALAIVARLLYLQVVSHDELLDLAVKQQHRTVEAPAKRGDIFDRQGRLLAYSVDADTVYATNKIGDPGETSAALCSVLRCTPDRVIRLERRLAARKPFVYVQRRVSPQQARRVGELNLPGVGFMKESRRFYPNRELAAHLLGYVGLDNVGLHGLEAAYDKVMLGRPGTVLVQTDARRRAFSRVERSPTMGGSLELTIDEHLQYIVERELAAGVDASNADGATAIVMDPATGEILAMASVPTFNPNDYNAADPMARRNRAVQDLYEPGSTFKVVTASAAIEEHVIDPTDMIDVSGGAIRFGSRVVQEYGGHRYGVLSFTDVIVKSSNVGAIKVGLQLGPERLGLYVNRFGFGKRTSRDFPSENTGIVWDPSRLNDSALASVSMGYQVGVTPIQMATAVSAVANGGRLLEPRVVRAVTKDGARTEVAPRVVRRAIKPGTAAEVTGIMEAVVERGTAKAARIGGFTVAGKTGTAEKLIDGHYSPTAHHASFVGFVPSRHPVFTIVVMIDTPRVGSRTGGVAAAPIFKRIAEAALRQASIPPTIAPPLPVMVDRRGVSPVTNTAARLDRNDGPAAVLPAPAMLPAGPPPANDPSLPAVPDVRGLGARDALRILARVGLSANMQGSGVVTAQTPEAGTPLDVGLTCTLVLHRDPPRAGNVTGTQP